MNSTTTHVEVRHHAEPDSQYVTTAEADELCREGWYRTGNVRAVIAEAPQAAATAPRGRGSKGGKGKRANASEGDAGAADSDD